jgi:hypothetical protein
MKKMMILNLINSRSIFTLYNGVFGIFARLHFDVGAEVNAQKFQTVDVGAFGGHQLLGRLEGLERLLLALAQLRGGVRLRVVRVARIDRVGAEGGLDGQFGVVGVAAEVGRVVVVLLLLGLSLKVRVDGDARRLLHNVELAQLFFVLGLAALLAADQREDGALALGRLLLLVVDLVHRARRVRVQVAQNPSRQLAVSQFFFVFVPAKPQSLVTIKKFSCQRPQKIEIKNKQRMNNVPK